MCVKVHRFRVQSSLKKYNTYVSAFVFLFKVGIDQSFMAQRVALTSVEPVTRTALTRGQPRAARKSTRAMLSVGWPGQTLTLKDVKFSVRFASPTQPK